MAKDRIVIPLQMFHGAQVIVDFCPLEWGATCNHYADPDRNYYVKMKFDLNHIDPGRFLVFLVHECVHAAQFIAKHYEIRDDEFDAYLVDTLVHEVLKRKSELRTR